MSTIRQRMAVALLSLSAAAFVGIVVDESYTGQAVIPTRNDRPTVGFGSTFHEDGRAVKLGDTTTPVRALVKVQAHVEREEQVRQRLRLDSLRCVDDENRSFACSERA